MCRSTRPVMISNAAAAWRITMPLPSSVAQPSVRAVRRSSVSRGK
jgi:hypothetical protein